MINFTEYKINKFKLYGGANGNKLGITMHGQDYMLKFPAIAKYNPEMSYANSTINEYISCQIINSLGIEAQETYLGTYNEKIVVACKDFEEEDYKFKDFAHLKNTIVDSDENGYGTELNSILETIDEQTLIDRSELKEYFWDMFIIDTLIANFDRHNGNWGFLINEKTQDVKLAPIFDCGSSLYPQANIENMTITLNNQEELEKRYYVYPTSAIKNDNIKINYFEYLMNTNNRDCLSSLEKISNRVDLNKINKIIENTPYINEIQKEFYKTVIKGRFYNILLNALEKNKK